MPRSRPGYRLAVQKRVARWHGGPVEHSNHCMSCWYAFRGDEWREQASRTRSEAAPFPSENLPSLSLANGFFHFFHFWPNLRFHQPAGFALPTASNACLCHREKAARTRRQAALQKTHFLAAPQLINDGFQIHELLALGNDC